MIDRYRIIVTVLCDQGIGMAGHPLIKKDFQLDAKEFAERHAIPAAIAAFQNAKEEDGKWQARTK